MMMHLALLIKTVHHTILTEVYTTALRYIALCSLQNLPPFTLTQKLTQAKYHESKWLIFCTIQYNSIYLITFGR